MGAIFLLTCPACVCWSRHKLKIFGFSWGCFMSLVSCRRDLVPLFADTFPCLQAGCFVGPSLQALRAVTMVDGLPRAPKFRKLLKSVCLSTFLYIVLCAFCCVWCIQAHCCCPTPFVRWSARLLVDRAPIVEHNVRWPTPVVGHHARCHTHVFFWRKLWFTGVAG